MKHKIYKSENYNFRFNRENGNFERWGKTFEDDPIEAPSPEILDIEVTTICKGPGGVPCPFCYKNGSTNGTNMSLDLFKKTLDKFPKDVICQLAVGCDAQAESNPDLWDMMKYARECDVVPNITVADITDETADKLASLCGAVAVSRYKDKDICYNSIKKLTDRGMNQVNMHILVSAETLPWIYETIKDIKNDSRLSKLNAMVLLSLKQKGRGKYFNRITKGQFKEIVDTCLDNEIRFGFDSCSAPKFLDAIQGHPMQKQFEMNAEPCESTLFSSYVNEKGEFFPCSFTEHCDSIGWSQGLKVADCDDFVKDIWNHPKTLDFRNRLLNCSGCRSCPVYEV